MTGAGSEDRREREDFAQRLREKDTMRAKERKEEARDRERKALLTSRYGESLSARVEQHLQNGESGIQESDLVAELRVRSRQDYLKKRELQQLQLAAASIEENSQLYRDERLSSRKIRDLEYRKQVVRLAQERRQAAAEAKVPRYELPNSYVTETGVNGKPRMDKELLDETIDQRGYSIGEKRQHKASADGRYDYVFDKDQHIKFVLGQTIDKDLSLVNFGNFKNGISSNHKSLRQQRYDAIKESRESLPVFKFKKELVDAIREHQVLVIVGETGSGKTTQITQYLHEAGFTTDSKKIICTQPRRVAAMSVAARVATEMDDKLGNEVGYCIRFEDCTSSNTKIKYVTDGMLLREILAEPDLTSYSVVMIDEAHERTLHTDVLLGLLKEIAKFRKDLRLLISSATMDAHKFSEYFDDAPIFNIPGRKFPVDLFYTKVPEANYMHACVMAVMQIHLTQEDGDVLVFLTGKEEIETVQDALQTVCQGLGSKIKEMVIAPIYAALPSAQQAEIFEPTPRNARKVVLATNIAETSITIDNIVFVVDTGFSKQKSFNPRTKVEALTITPCSRASANQRAGRAGRVKPGKCFRLYTRWAYENELIESTVPEILRSNLASTVLMLMTLGVTNLMEFDFIDAPPVETLKQALEQLYAQGAVNSAGELTKLGRQMAEFPLEPMLSGSLLASGKHKVPNAMASIAAMLSVKQAIFQMPRDREQAARADHAHKALRHESGDHVTMLQVWRGWQESEFSGQWCTENYVNARSMRQARDIREQLIRLMQRVEIDVPENDDPAQQQEDDDDSEDDEGKADDHKLETPRAKQDVAARQRGEIVRVLKCVAAGFFGNAAMHMGRQAINRHRRHGKDQEGSGTGGAGGAEYQAIKRGNGGCGSLRLHPSSALCPLRPRPYLVVYHELVQTTHVYMSGASAVRAEWLLKAAPHFYNISDFRPPSAREIVQSARAANRARQRQQHRDQHDRYH